MAQSPRQPVDLMAVTKDVKARLRRVIGELEAIELQQDPVFASPRDVYVDLDIAIHHLESAMSRMRVAWWPVIVIIVVMTMASPAFAVVLRQVPHARHETPRHQFHFPRPPETVLAV
jgi:hypothetical protein